MDNNAILRTAAWGVTAALAITLLVVAQDILVPFVLAAVLWYIVLLVWHPLKNLLPRTPWAHWGTLAVAFLAIGLLATWLYGITAGSLATAMGSAADYQLKITTLANQLLGSFGLSDDIGNADALLARINIEQLLLAAAGQVAAVAGMASVVAIYLAFFAVEYHTFGAKLRAMVTTDARYHAVMEVLTDIHNDIKAYLRIMTISSAITAGLSYLLLVAVGVDFAGLWLVLIFFLNYLATLGSLLGVVLPTAFAILQFGQVAPVLIVAVGLALAQGIVGNVIEPRLMGKSLNLSPLAILLALAVWGEIWGIVGMLLSVPIMAAISVVCARFPGTRAIAVLLSEEGEVSETGHHRRRH